MKNEHSAPAVTNNTQQTPTKAEVRAKPARLNIKTRKAIDLMIATGQTQRWCAKQAGINEDAFSRSLKKPQYAEYKQQQEILALQDLKALKKMAQVAALNKGIDLMNNASSEAVKARMVELLMGKDAKNGAATVVNVQNNMGSTGYEMARPGQRVVDIVSDGPNVDATDSKSVDHTPDEQ